MWVLLRCCWKSNGCKLYRRKRNDSIWSKWINWSELSRHLILWITLHSNDVRADCLKEHWTFKLICLRTLFRGYYNRWCIFSVFYEKEWCMKKKMYEFDPFRSFACLAEAECKTANFVLAHECLLLRIIHFEEKENHQDK